MNWNTLISAKRFGLEEFHQERHENRSEFQRDYLLCPLPPSAEQNPGIPSSR